jgi:hypothetical protein
MSGRVITSSLWFGTFICLSLWILGVLAGTTIMPLPVSLFLAVVAILSGTDSRPEMHQQTLIALAVLGIGCLAFPPLFGLVLGALAVFALKAIIYQILTGI